MNIKIAAAGGIAALLFLSGCSSDTDEATAPTTSAAAPSESAMASEPAMAEPGTIVEVAASNPDFETLVAAVTAAGLAETLSVRVRSRSSPRLTRRSTRCPRACSMLCCSRRTRTP